MAASRCQTHAATPVSVAGMDLPLGLRTAIQSGRAVLFVGSGIGYEAQDQKGDCAPDGRGLAAELAAKFGIHDASDDLAEVAGIVELRKGRAELVAFLAKRLADLEPSEHVLSLLSHRWGAIFTTNYDRVIERAYERLADPCQTPVVISSTGSLVETDPRFEVPVYHIHGALFDGGTRPDILITDGDYARFGERRRMLFETLKQRFATSPFLYVGYSHQDSNWRTLQAEMRAEFQPGKPPRAYRVAPSTATLNVELLAAMDIETISGTVKDLAEAAAGITSEDGDQLKRLAATVPPVLGAAFEANPAAVGRLLSSWELVNFAAFDAELNTEAFLAGDLPNWALAASDRTFTRDIEEPLYDELIDFATDDSAKPVVLALLGSAGYGVTTVLMKTAARLVNDEAGPVFMHRRGTPLIEGDIDFASGALDGRPFFIVDNAADEGQEVINAVRRLRERSRPAFFLLGDRVNEWRQRRFRISPTEMEIEALSDPEVDRLIACLERNDALGKLRDLEPPLRVAAIKEKHEKQLLVAMKEATENDAFDAIIEDEFLSIDGVPAQQLYAAVCGFYRLRIPVRIETLGSAVGVSATDLYSNIGPSLEGIIRIEAVDEDKGIYTARARAQVIAEIVWERMVDGPERDRLFQASLDALNLSYGLDAKAFEAFVRNDRGIDGIGTFEAKVRFFDRAAVKDPDNPYVLQHYARMLLRENKAELALGIIDRALKLKPDYRVLSHTKGLILRHMAFGAESAEIARRRLAQSESALRESFGAKRNDAYTYQALAELYLGWAKRADIEETTLYVTKAEEVIQEGLRQADDKEGLWQVSASVEEFLGNEPQAVAALEQAVKESPTSSIPRYLLARAHRRARNWRAVVDTLQPALEIDPQDYRSATLLARAYERTGEPYSKCVAVMKLADLYGRRDPRFVATFGGMLTLDGELTQAKALFAQRRSGMSYAASNRIEYRPRPGDQLAARLDGVVLNVQSGYAFIQVPGLSDFFCPGPEIGRHSLRRGSRVSFVPAFNARGGVVTDLRTDAGAGPQPA